MLYSTIPVKYNILIFIYMLIQLSFSDSYFILQSKVDSQFWKNPFLCLCVANFDRNNLATLSENNPK